MVDDQVACVEQRRSKPVSIALMPWSKSRKLSVPWSRRSMATAVGGFTRGPGRSADLQECRGNPHPPRPGPPAGGCRKPDKSRSCRQAPGRCRVAQEGGVFI